MRALGIDLVVDVGANTGQYASLLRSSGYRGRIVSFEPAEQPFLALTVRAAADPTWATFKMALGDTEALGTLHLTGNSVSSSMLNMLESHTQAEPTSKYVGSEAVQVRTLASMGPVILVDATRPYLKADVQGYELAVLRGAGDLLGRFHALELELSLVQLYADAPSADEVILYVRHQGFALAGVEAGFTDPASGQLLQMDGIFVREQLLPVPITSNAKPAAVEGRPR
jgi:FkbM family methyltransferase